MFIYELRLYLFILINDICRDAFVDHFGEDGWSWGAVLLAGFLCQPHLVTFGAQGSLGVNNGHASHMGKSKSCFKYVSQ